MTFTRPVARRFRRFSVRRSSSSDVSRFDLSGSVAVVTGGAGRLGPVWVAALLDAGASVVSLDLASAQPSKGAREVRERAGRRLLEVHADVCDRDSLERALQRCREDVGTPDILINNAGIDQPPGPVQSRLLEDIPLEDVRRVLDVNVAGTFLCTQVFGGAMLQQRRGSIVNVGSLYASVSPDHRLYDHIDVDPPFLKPPGYGPSKAAVVAMTKYFATHWAPYGVRVNVLSPGGVAGGQDPVFVEKFTARVPLGRMAAPDDLAGPLVFLASEAAGYVTGCELRVDGGYTAW